MGVYLWVRYPCTLECCCVQSEAWNPESGFQFLDRNVRQVWDSPHTRRSRGSFPTMFVRPDGAVLGGTTPSRVPYSTGWVTVSGVGFQTTGWSSMTKEREAGERQQVMSP